MICPACGVANEDGVLFCEKCKADLDMPAAVPPQVGNMTDPAVPQSADSPAVPSNEEPIPLEPISLEPSPDAVPPADVEPSSQSPEAPIELEPVGQGPTVEQPAVGDTKEEAPSGKPKTGTPPPLPPQADIPTSPKLVVVRGQRMDVQYPLYAGKNYLGRTDDKPVDIDLDDQEAPDRIWTSRQHAVVTFDNGKLTVEDLNSLNGTFVNRTRVHPGQVKELHENDVIQVGTVHLKVLFG